MTTKNNGANGITGYGLCSIQGRRYNMEDAHIALNPINPANPNIAFFAIYDGHDGIRTADYCAAHLHEHLMNNKNFPGDIETALIESIAETDAEIGADEKLRRSGSTAIVAVVTEDKIYIANVGDARAVLSENGKMVKLSDDFRASDPAETERILRAGGGSYEGRVFVKIGDIGVVRAFGDYTVVGSLDILKINLGLEKANLGRGEFGLYAHEGTLSTLPEAEKTQLVQNFDENAKLIISVPQIVVHVLTPQTDFLILTCDGVFERDKVSREDAVATVAQALEKNSNTPDRETIAAKALVDLAYERGSQDNLSCMVVTFGKTAQTK